MPITALPALDRTSVNFKANVDTFFGSQLPTFSTEAEAARVEINAKEASATASAATATTKAGEALTSANNAATSKTDADTARDAAVVARTAAEAALDSFDDRYLGAKAVAPTLDNDGNALLTGALYWDTALPGMRSWNGTAWVTLPAATAAAISNTPAGNIAATTVQAAIDELDAEKAALAGSTTQGFSASTVNGAAPLHHNDIINGDFPIAQAGTSFAAPANGAYDLDGWANLNTSAAVFTVAQVAGSTSGRLARQVTITTDATVAAGDYVCDSAAIEGYNVEKYVGNTFTIGFRAKVPVAGVHCVALRNSGNDRSYVKEINFPTANVWQDCSFTVTGGLPTAGTWNYTNGTGLKVTFARMVGATFQTTPDAWNTGNFLGTVNQVNDCATVGNVWALEKVTLNLGTVAAVSEISYEAELVRCQRYLPIILAGVNGSSGFACQGFAQSASQANLLYQFKVPPRVPPTGLLAVNIGSFGATTQAASGTGTSAVFTAATIDGCNFYLNTTATTFTAGAALFMTTQGVSGSIQFTGCRL